MRKNDARRYLFRVLSEIREALCAKMTRDNTYFTFPMKSGKQGAQKKRATIPISRSQRNQGSKARKKNARRYLFYISGEIREARRAKLTRDDTYFAFSAKSGKQGAKKTRDNTYFAFPAEIREVLRAKLTRDNTYFAFPAKSGKQGAQKKRATIPILHFRPKSEKYCAQKTRISFGARRLF